MFRFEVVDVKTVRPFIEQYHYSKSINGCKVSRCYAIYDGTELVGAALFGPLSTTAWKKYGDVESDVVELRRLVCLDELPRNTESWFIAQCIKHLKKTTAFRVCVSYADPYHGHVGYVYQASNWTYVGRTSPDVLLKTPDGKLYHSRAMRTKYKGKLKPFALRLIAMQDAGSLVSVPVPGKYVYLYALTGVQVSNPASYPKKLSA